MKKEVRKKKRKLPKWLHHILELFERFTEKIIPYLLILLAVILVLENPFWTLVHLEHYEPWITIMDYFIITFFVIDLIFKWFRVRHILKFLKLFWLDIIAVFPFFFIFRMYLRVSTLVVIGQEISEAQKIAHEAVLLREARIIREAELLKETRFLRELKPATRLTRAVQRFLRLLRARLHIGASTAHVYKPGKNIKVKKKKSRKTAKRRRSKK